MNPSFSGSYRDLVDIWGLAHAIYQADDNCGNIIFIDVNSGIEEIEKMKNLIGKRLTFHAN